MGLVFGRPHQQGFGPRLRDIDVEVNVHRRQVFLGLGQRLRMRRVVLHQRRRHG